MGARVSLEASELSVEPGKSTTVKVSISNTGSIVERFDVCVLGPQAACASVEPSFVSLFPGTEGSVTVTFAPTRQPATEPGRFVFGVKAIPANNPAESSVEEGWLTVTSYHEVGADLIPAASRSRWRSGKLGLAVDNRGNVPEPISVNGLDPTARIMVKPRPATTTIAPGHTGFMRLRVRPRHRMIRGIQQHHRFKVRVQPEGQPPISKDASHLQKPLLPRMAFPFIAILVIAVVLLVMHWPRPQSTAVMAASQQNPAAQAAAAAAQAAAAAASAVQHASSSTAAPAASASAGTTTTAAGGATTTTVAGGATTTTSTPQPTTGPVPGPFDQMLEATSQSGSTGTATLTVPAGMTLSVTDMVLQNVQPDQGVLRVQLQLPPTASKRSVPAVQSPPTDLFVAGLSNLSTEAYSFSSNLLLQPGDQLITQVECGQSPAPAVSVPCDAGAYVAGQLAPVPSKQAASPLPYAQMLEATAQTGSTGSATVTVPTGASLSLTDLILQNVQPDQGVVRVQLQLPPVPSTNGGAPVTPAPVNLFFAGLSGMQSEDYTFTTPLVLAAGDQLVVQLTCAAPVTSTTTVPPSALQNCDAGAFVSGQLTTTSSSAKG